MSAVAPTTGNPNRPLPEPTDWDRGYWDAARDHRLTVQHCDDCGLVRSFPRLGCPACGSYEFGWREVSGRGTIYSYTVLRREFHHGFTDLPLVTCIIELDDEPSVHLVSNLVGLDDEDDPLSRVRIGAPVRVEFESFGDIVLPQFLLV